MVTNLDAIIDYILKEIGGLNIVVETILPYWRNLRECSEFFLCFASEHKHNQ